MHNTAQNYTENNFISFPYTKDPGNGDLWAANVIKVQHLIDKEGKDTYGEASVGKLLWRHFHRVQDGFIMRFIK